VWEKRKKKKEWVETSQNKIIEKRETEKRRKSRGQVGKKHPSHPVN